MSNRNLHTAFDENGSITLDLQLQRFTTNMRGRNKPIVDSDNHAIANKKMISVCGFIEVSNFDYRLRGEVGLNFVKVKRGQFVEIDETISNQIDLADSTHRGNIVTDVGIHIKRIGLAKVIDAELFDDKFVSSSEKEVENEPSMFLVDADDLEGFWIHERVSRNDVERLTKFGFVVSI